MKRTMLLAAYDAVESLASLSSRVESRFRSDKKRTLKSAPVVGHNGFRYRVHSDWGIPDEPSRYPVKDCHEMVVDSLGRIVLLTNHQKNNILIYNADGQIVDSWTLGFRSAHGLSLIHEQGRDVLFICDYRSQSVVKTDMNGNILMRLPTAGELGIYEEPYKYLPTGTAIASNGDIYVADGYGASFVIQFDRHGDYIRHFGGRGKKPEHINQAHGIAIDGRSGVETVLVSSRENTCFKRYSLTGEYLSSIELHGAYVCRPVVHEENIYAGVCWSGKLFRPNSGFVTILDKSDRVVSNLGGSEPFYENGKLKSIRQHGSLFKHCHDVCLDAAGNIYVCQWNAQGAYPIKLERLSES